MHTLKLFSASLLSLSILLTISSCSSGGSGPPTTTTGTGGTTTPPSAAGIYVIQDIDFFLPPSPSLILQYPRTANGATAPALTITGPANLIFDAVALDSTGNLYVGGDIYAPSSISNYAGVNILVYPPGSTGTATPSRSISPSSLNQVPSNPINGLAVDASGNLYVSADVVIGSGPSNRIYSGLSVFPSTASGNATPTRVIAGDLTTLFNPQQIAVDSTGNIYVASSQVPQPDSILIFSPTATGNVAPTSVLGGDATTIYYVRGVALDAQGNIYVSTRAQDISTPNGTFQGAPSILEFSRGSTGNVAPIRTISGAATTLSVSRNLTVDSAGNIYTLNGFNILMFAPSASGNVAPTAVIAPSGTSGYNGGSIAVQ